MRDYIKSVVDPNLTRNQNLNRIREYLQTYFLNIIYKNKFYQNLVFTGGTALRFIYRIRRFSEDLDFSLSSKARNYNFTDMVENVLQEFKLAGYDLEIKFDESRAVHSALLKFSGILFETGLSPLKGQKIAIKAEVDSRPPSGGIETSSVYNSNFMFYMLHYDLASLFAGKVHALLCREYTKGRDWYDLLWYLTKFKDLEPNFIMLNNAFAQTSRKPVKLTANNWKAEIKKTVEILDWAKVRNDVSWLLEDSSELGLLESKTFINLLRK